jgi:predicted transposase YbfD/YdcC
MTAKKTARAVDLKSYVATLEDPRDGPAQLHNLLDIVIIAICAIICGADSWTEVEAFGKAKAAWLGTFLELPHGIPSHDTFGRVFRHLDPVAFEARFREWTQAVRAHTAGQVIALDGKCLRHSGDAELGKAAIYMVSAWATADHLVLGQRKVAEKSNEITAIPELLQVLDVQGCIVSIDAMGTQKAIAAQIVARGGEYLLAVKDNQPHLREDIQALFEWATQMEYLNIQHAHWQTTNKGHGRIEVRDCWTISDPACIRMVADWEAWEQLQTVVYIRAQRTRQGQTSVEERYYISSIPAQGARTAQQALSAVRQHWGIENQVHWVLDMAFREDACCVHKDHGDENLAVLRHIALNCLRQDDQTRLGVHGKRLKAAWDTDYLSLLLGF